MAEKQSYEDKMLEAFRESLGEIDEIAQVTLKSHILIEAQLVDILVLLVDEPEYLEKANLRFYQKANLLRATIFHEDGDKGWPLVLAFNKLRNTIAHGGANDEPTVQIEVLRGMLLPIVTEETKEQVQKGSELEIATLAAAMASGFLVDVENQMRREQGPEETGGFLGGRLTRNDRAFYRSRARPCARPNSSARRERRPDLSRSAL